MSRIVLTAASRVGNVRSNNEDMVYAYDKFIRSDAYHTEFMTENVDRFVVSLADGMGGHQAGEVASELVLQNLKFYVSDLPRGLSSGEFTEMMYNWHVSVNNTVNARGHSYASQREMGTTLVAVIYYNQKYYWLNCGDSRLYRLRDGKLTQLTTDHSLNTMTGQAKHSNVLTNCIGAGCKNSYLDLIEFTNDIMSGDTYLLCSDGLNDMLPNDIIERMLVEHSTANALCEAAIEAGGFDNVSACVFDVESV